MTSRWRTSARGAAGTGLLLVLVLSVSACGSGASGTSATTTSSPTRATTAVAASSGCGTQASSGTTTLTPTVDGRVRTAIVHVPTGYRDTEPVALVLNLHGSQSTALEQEGFSGMDATADADTFIVAYPQGDIPAGSGFEWNVPGQPLFGGSAVPAGSADDVTFLTQLVGILERDYCIDGRRVYATGFSGGSRMASQLACDASSVVAAVAPVSGLRFPAPCPSTRPVPVLSFHGTADPVDPYNGHGQAYWTYSVPTAAARWGAHNGCAAAPTRHKLGTGATLTTYRRCHAGATVALYTLTGEGHEWPGGPHLPKSLTKTLGPQSDAVDANTVMWAFFRAHPLP